MTCDVLGLGSTRGRITTNCAMHSVVASEGKGRMTGKQWFLQQEKAGVQVSEVPSDDDEETFEEEQRRAEEARLLREAEDDEDFDPDEEDEDDDDDEMLDEMLAGRE